MIKSDQFITDEIRKAAEQEALANLMNAFSEGMFQKVMAKLAQGKRGWDKPEIIETLKGQLADNINSGDWVDVAIISMFLWNIKQPDKPEVAVTNAPPVAEPTNEVRPVPPPPQ